MPLHEEPGRVDWSTLQRELTQTGLTVGTEFSDSHIPWLAFLIDGSPAVMEVKPRDPTDGLRHSMSVGLTGQDEITVIPRLEEFMGYSPFARYRDKKSPVVYYEWDKDDPTGHISEIAVASIYSDLERLDAGFPMEERPMDYYFGQVDLDRVTKSEQAGKQDPNAKLGENSLKPFLPFLKEVMPRVAPSQSLTGLNLTGLNLISLSFRPANEAAVIQYGLEPLIRADVLTEDDLREIVGWFKVSHPSRNSDLIGTYKFRRGILVDGHEYTLATNNYGSSRDLNVLVGPPAIFPPLF